MPTTSDADLSSLRIRRDDPSDRPRGSRRWLVLGVVLAAVALVAWFLLRPRPVEVTVTRAEAVGGGAAPGGNISANGYVVARTKASVSAKIAGRLAFLGPSEGSEVKRGEIIARLENDDVRAALAAARATVGQTEVQLAQARRELVRARSLREQDLASDFDLESAETQVDVLQAQLAADRARVGVAEANLENTNVRAPFDGTVLRKDAEVGEIVAPSSAGGGLTRTAIVTMADLATLEVEVDVNEAYIARVRNGQAAAITLDAYPDTSFAGRVRQVVPTADRQKATVQVKVSILDRDPRILPEMGAKVEFLRPGPEGGAEADIGRATVRRVTVPVRATVDGPEGVSVWIVADDVARRRRVEIGAVRADRVEILEGLAGGEQVVLDPDERLEDGCRVRATG